MRALVLSHHYADPAHRQKLRELAGLGWTVTLALPGGIAGMDVAVRLAPIPVAGPADRPASVRWNRRALRRLMTDVTTALQFPSILYLLDGWCRTHGARLDILPCPDGVGADPARLLEAIDEKTLCVAISHVEFRSAFINDAAALAHRCRRSAPCCSSTSSSRPESSPSRPSGGGWTPPSAAA